ncbi:GNAT family N-acetyltransferase [Isoptericola sp. b441]|uniref:GNAT family N-acetyltransferase n=1 Tax=Actinotalea lenta TaxID=3064654 RepID=A0ABT9DC46_9CELL|nr:MULTISPECIES: GNAT family N-acetyltransferase [unclassified Isoptericola]MDO8108454.1 GNAT family N-acetyltransferase [Isoptericola sp. b441]MDO8119873.1 GNAT family N-acetyltransferase [Isoptericola sp. b490]
MPGAGQGTIRAARRPDAAALADICLRTADSGRDATGLLTDDGLWADLFALPYLVLDPGLAFVLDVAGSVQGYVVGTADSAAFAAAVRRDWLPRVGGRYPPGPRPTALEEGLVRALHEPERDLLPELAPYPAHLHIDLLPAVQGHGWGRRLMSTLFAAARDRGAPGVHLGIAPDNERALAFYRHLGMQELRLAQGVFLVAPSDLL